MCFVDDQRVVAAQIAVALGFGEQDAIGHHLNQIVSAAFVAEAHLVADQIARLRLQFLSNARRHRARGDTARLRAADKARGTTFQVEANFRQLRRLAGAGFTRDHNHLMRGDGARDLLALGSDGEFFRIGDDRDAGQAGLGFGAIHDDEGLSWRRKAGKGDFPLHDGLGKSKSSYLGTAEEIRCTV